MTTRAYWDCFGALWEETRFPDQSVLRLVWSPDGPVIGTVTLSRTQVEKALGPLVGVA